MTRIYKENRVYKNPKPVLVVRTFTRICDGCGVEYTGKGRRYHNRACYHRHHRSTRRPGLCGWCSRPVTWAVTAEGRRPFNTDDGRDHLISCPGTSETTKRARVARERQQEALKA